MHKAFLAVVVAAILGGALPVFVKIGVEVFPPFTYTLIRFTIAGLCMISIFIKDIPRVKGSLLKIIGLSLLPTLNVVLFAFGIKHTTAIIGQTLYASVPLFVALLSFFILAEKLTTYKIIGLITGFIGVGLIINFQNLFTDQTLRGEMVGNIIILTAVISYCFYQIFSKKLSKNYKPVHLTMFFFMTAIVSQSFLSTTELSKIPQWSQQLSLYIVGTVLYVGIVGTAIYYYLNQYAIKVGSPTIASLTLYLQPVFTFVWASLLLGEQLTIPFVVGSGLVFLGVWLNSR